MTAFRRFLLIFVLIWCLLALVTLTAVRTQVESYLLASSERILFFFGAFTLAILEGIIIAGCFASAKRLAITMGQKFRLTRLLVGTASIAFATAFFLLIIFDWVFWWNGIGFLNQDTVISSLHDIVRTLRHFTLTETTAATGISATALVLSILLYRLAPPLTADSLRTFLKVSAGMVIVSLLSMRIVPAYLLREDSAQTFRVLVTNNASPLAPLLWGPLMYYSPQQKVTFSRVPEPRYSLEEYRSRIDHSLARKNIIVIIADALRSDLIFKKSQNREIAPTLNRMAREGRYFSQAFSQSNESSYSITSLATGLFPLKSVTRDHFTSVRPHTVRIYDLLSTEYQTAYLSSANEHWRNMINMLQSDSLDLFFHSENRKEEALEHPVGDPSFAREFEKGRLSTGKLDDRLVFEEAESWINSTHSKYPEKPFFAILNLQATHFPYEQGKNVPKVFSPSELSLSDRTKFSFLQYPIHLKEKIQNRYYNSVNYIDSLIAELLSFLEKLKIKEDTIIFVLGDHGELFHEHGAVAHGGALWNESLNVLAVMWNAERTKKGEDQTPIMLIDIAPTILSLAKFPPFGGFQGKNILHKDNEGSSVRPFFASIQLLDQQDTIMAGRWKLIHTRASNQFHLFDRINDPGENRNVAAEHPQLRKCLEKTLKKFVSEQVWYFHKSSLQEKYFPPKYRADFLSCEPSLLE